MAAEPADRKALPPHRGRPAGLSSPALACIIGANRGDSLRLKAQVPGANGVAKALVLEIDQVQPSEWGEFTFRLPLVARSASGATEPLVAMVSGRNWVQEIPVDQVPNELLLDPEHSLLIEILEIAGPS